jgi:ABC-2 type transport system permease protein
MSPRITLRTAGRILRQLRHDPRTLALIVAVPSVLLVLLRYVFNSNPAVFDRVGLLMLGVFPFTSMFLVTSVAMLRERTSGTLERLLTTPMAKLDLLLGYGLAFAVAAAVQGACAALVAFLWLGLDLSGSPAMIAALAVANALLGMGFGLFTSAFAASEFQAVQFMPVVVLPQALLCGLLVPVETMAAPLQAASRVLPLTYAVDALSRVGAGAGLSGRVALDVAVIAGTLLLLLVLAAATLRRRSA